MTIRQIGSGIQEWEKRTTRQALFAAGGCGWSPSGGWRRPLRPRSPQLPASGSGRAFAASNARQTFLLGDLLELLASLGAARKARPAGPPPAHSRARGGTDVRAADRRGAPQGATPTGMLTRVGGPGRSRRHGPPGWRAATPSRTDRPLPLSPRWSPVSRWPPRAALRIQRIDAGEAGLARLIRATFTLPKHRTVGDDDSRAGYPTIGVTVVGAPAVETDRLVKHYRGVAAVRGVSFAVAAREIFGFLGPNGAGKSTTIKILCTLARPSAGWARVAGFDTITEPREVRRRIGVVFQGQTLDQQLTAEENLRFHAVLYGMPRALVGPRVDRVLALVDLTERRRSLVSTYSGGMARRLEIARALLHTPAVLFLDEPTVGLDPQTRVRIWADLHRLREEEQVTVFFTTHYMDEADCADRIAIIDHGRIVAADTPAGLKATIGHDTVRLATADDAAAASALAAAGITTTVVEGGLVVRVDDGQRAVARLIAAAGVPVRQVCVHRPTLDDVFMHYTGRAIRDKPIDGRATVLRRMMAVRARR